MNNNCQSILGGAQAVCHHEHVIGCLDWDEYTLSGLRKAPTAQYHHIHFLVSSGCQCPSQDLCWEENRAYWTHLSLVHRHQRSLLKFIVSGADEVNNQFEVFKAPHWQTWTEIITRMSVDSTPWRRNTCRCCWSARVDQTLNCSSCSVLMTEGFFLCYVKHTFTLCSPSLLPVLHSPHTP